MPPYARKYVKRYRGGRYITKNINQYRRRSRGYRGMGRVGFTEKKYFDNWWSKQIGLAGEYKTFIEETSTDGSAGGATTLAFAPNQGFKSYERQGRRVWLSDFKFRGKIYWNTDDTSLTNNIQSVTVIVVLDRSVDKSADPWDPDVFQEQWNSGNAVSPDIRADVFQNTEEFGRYRVLKRKVYKRPVRATADTTWNQLGETGVKFKHVFKRPVIVNYGMEVTGDQENVTDNGIRVMVIADGMDPTYTQNPGDNPILRMTARFGFYDHKT